MEIRKCNIDDIVKVGEFYDMVVKHLDENINYPKWEYRVYPSEDSVRVKIQEQSQFLCEDAGKIVGAFVLNDDPAGAYEKVAWSKQLAEGEYMVCHTLATAPDQQGRGLGKQFVEYCVAYAKEQGFQGIRLDVVPDNIPARRLYEKCGFNYVGDVDLERDIEEIPLFSLYELNF